MADRMDYYVYVLFRENGSPFYVGKGYGRRWLMHETAYALRRKSHRAAIIADMVARDVEVPKVKLHEGLTNAIACEHMPRLRATRRAGRSQRFGRPGVRAFQADKALNSYPQGQRRAM